MTNLRLKPRDRKRQILDGAVNLAAQIGYMNLTREGLAVSLQVSPALVSHYLGTMTQLRRHVMRAAVQRQALSIIAQGLALKDKQAQRAPEELRRRALAAIE